jgi:hypothetical protein
VALKTQGSVLKRNGVEVAQITGLNGPDGEAATIDVTHLQSVRKEYLVGLADEGTIGVTGWVDPDDTAQMGMKADRDASNASPYTIELTDTPPTVLSFTAYCPQFAVAAQPDGAWALTATLRVTSEVIWS